jgi:hypothetical protein
VKVYTLRQKKHDGLFHKKGKGNTDGNSKVKKNARWISRCAQNKPKQNIDQKPIILSKDSDSEIE